MIIQKMRLQRGWSQQQLAELSGLSVRTIQRIEQGKLASNESLKSLAAVFNVDFSVFKEPDMELKLHSGSSADEELAFNYVRKLKGFYSHAIKYVVVICILAAVNYLKTPHVLWVPWVAAGWGLGLFFHGLRVFDKFSPLGAEWERKQVEKRLGRKI